MNPVRRSVWYRLEHLYPHGGQDPQRHSADSMPIDHGRRLRRLHGARRGRGYAGARLDYLPEHATDFAFASLSEQRGFVGAGVLLLLYLLVVWRD